MNKVHKKKLAAHKESLAERDAKANSLMAQLKEEWEEDYLKEEDDPTSVDAAKRDERWEKYGLLTTLVKVERRLGFHWKAGREEWGVPNTLIARRTS